VEANLAWAAAPAGVTGSSFYVRPVALARQLVGFSATIEAVFRFPERLFETWYGTLYDAGVQSRLAPLGGFLLWGADVGRLFGEMAEGTACAPGEIVLDCPTGGGVTFARGLSRTRGLLLAADLSALMLRRAAERRAAIRQRRRVALLRADATRLPLAGASIDRVLCFNSLHCIPRHGAVLREFRRVLKPGGELRGSTLIADAPPPWSVNVLGARLSGVFFPPDSRRLEAAARRSGFDRWEAERTGALLFFRARYG
jgi:SAM-dependent methyltransferase